MIKTTIKTIAESFATTTIDSIQTAKKIAVDTFVKHEDLAKSLNDFVDAQTTYTKQAIDAGIKTGSQVFDVITDKSFYTDSFKAAQDAVSKFASRKAD